MPHVGPSWGFGEETAASPAAEDDDAPLALPPGIDAAPQPPGAPPPEGDVTAEADAVDESLLAWAAQVAPVVGVPERVLQAYGNAEVTLRQENPACNLAWTTLAGIGAVESNHGTTGGTEVTEDGTTADPIRGPALDGTDGNKHIPDTDDGRWDDDDELDRAVGPMQFIPQTWEQWQADGNGDGISDPNQIDDATLAAGRYLCADDRDLSRAADWYAAVFAYNHVDSYVRDVYDRADEYGTLSRNT